MLKTRKNILFIGLNRGFEFKTVIGL